MILKCEEKILVLNLETIKHLKFLNHHFLPLIRGDHWWEVVGGWQGRGEGLKTGLTEIHKIHSAD